MLAIFAEVGSGVVAGFIVAMYVMRWGISDLRENARRAIRLRNQAEEVIDNMHREIRRLRSEIESGR